MAEVEKIVVFTGELSYSVRKNIVTLDRAIPGLDWLILVHSPKSSLTQILIRQWHNLRRHGWRRIPQVVVAIRDRLSARFNPPALVESIGSEYTAEGLQRLPNVRVAHVSDIHAQTVLDRVRAFEADLGISLAAPILQSSLFSIPAHGSLNLHKGKVPEYRGMPPAFWEIWNEEQDVGCTIHWLAQGLDTGPIAATTSINREKYSTVKGLQLCLDEVGIDLMRNVVVEIAGGVQHRVPQNPGGNTYRQPTLAQVAELERRVARQLPPQQPLAKRILKNVIRRTFFTLGIAGLYRIAAPRATILLYHRVTDSARDNLTTGIEQFDRQMRLLRRHFRVISLSELLEQKVVQKSDKPIACVTFDDGYLDNYQNAFPILLRNQIPAAFFVSTGLIGTDGQFSHDIRRGNQPIPLMQWDHLREMREAGYIIGSHTVNHIDCAAEPEALVRDELRHSKDALAKELGIESQIFSYPYGGRHHMTEERLELVKEAGYIGCVSAYGGANVGMVDRYNLLRCGGHWEFSDSSFLCLVLGL